MNENTVVGRLLSGADPQSISREIVSGLANSGRFGYHAIFEESLSEEGSLKITFIASTGRQEIVLPNWSWRDLGRIQQAIMEELAI